MLNNLQIQPVIIGQCYRAGAVALKSAAILEGTQAHAIVEKNVSKTSAGRINPVLPCVLLFQHPVFQEINLLHSFSQVTVVSHHNDAGTQFGV